MQKLCKKCQNEKPIDDFYKDPKSVDGHRTYCKLCCRTIGQTWIKNNRSHHNERCSNYIVKHRRNQKQKLVELAGGKCKLCGYDRCISAFDFHHLDPSKKDFTIATALSSARSMEQLTIEIEKCILLCCRCHRELHAGLVSYELPD